MRAEIVFMRAERPAVASYPMRAEIVLRMCECVLKLCAGRPVVVSYPMRAIMCAKRRAAVNPPL